MRFWEGFFQALKGYIKWREASKAQKRRFTVLLADSKAYALEEEIVGLRGALKSHVEDYHGGKKPKTKKSVLEIPENLGDNPQNYPLTKLEMEAYILGN